MSGPRRSTFRANQVSYATVGVTQEPGVLRFPPEGFVSGRTERRVGSGQDRFLAASEDLRSGAFFARAGIVATTDSGSPVTAAALRGETPTIRLARVWSPLRLMSDYRVIYAVKEDRKVAFALGTLGDWPMRGEISFVVSWREDDTVWSEVTTVTQRHPHWSITALAPLLRMRERALRVRYARAVNPVKSVT